ncbi:MAG: glycosyltransferase family 4 protein [Pseudomonadota bacterium]|jgi:glycogen(starch) synthase
MRVGVLSQEMYPLFYGGIGVQMYLVAKCLVEAGHSVEFFTKGLTGAHPDMASQLPAGIRVHFVSSHSTPDWDYLPSLSYARRAERLVRKVHEQSELDLLLVTDFGGESLFLQLAPLLRRDGRDVPMVMTIHGASRDVNQANLRTLTLEDEIICLQEEIAIACSSVCLAPSQIYWKQILERLDLAEMPVRIIPNFFNRELFSDPIPSVSSGSEHKSDRKKIVFVGRLEYRKGIDILLAAFDRVASSRSDIELHIVGRDLEWSEYKGYFSEYWLSKLSLEVAQMVHFHGHKSPEELKSLIQSAYVAVFPSRWEPFGIVALEAMATGMPVVVTAGTGLAEIVGARYELLIDRDSSDSDLERVLKKVIDDDVLRDRIGAECRILADELCNRAQRDLLAALNELQSRGLSSSRKLPGRLIARLQASVLEYGVGCAAASRNDSHELIKAVEVRDAIIQTEQQKILQKDTEILKRDAIISAQQEEIARLKRSPQGTH